MKTLFTSRLALRAWAWDDIDALYAYARSPDVGPNAGWKPHASREESMEVLSAFIELGQDWAITIKESGAVIGSIGLRPDPRREPERAYTIGYVLAREYWGQGLTTEAVRRAVRYAFEEMAADVLSVAHYPFNTRSKRVIEKCGFHYEGTLRRAAKIYDGSVYDLSCYSMLHEEYFQFATEEKDGV